MCKNCAFVQAHSYVIIVCCMLYSSHEARTTVYLILDCGNMRIRAVSLHRPDEAARCHTSVTNSSTKIDCW